MRKVRIIRKRRSALYRVYGVLRLLEWIIKPLAVKSKAEREAEYAKVRNDRLRVDTQLKLFRHSLVAEQLRRVELLNIEKMRELGIDTKDEVAAFGKGQQEEPHY